MIRRFFEGLKQGVESALGHHMDFIDDVDFVFALDWGVIYFLNKLTDLIHAIIAGGVDFNDVWMGPRIESLAV